MSTASVPGLGSAPQPPLQTGDRLTRAEFQGRLERLPDGVKAELIEGVVYMPPPVFEEHHGSPQYDLVTWLGVYRAATPGVVGADNTTVRLDQRNMPQPDVYLRILETHGGRSRRSADGYLDGVPELIAEIAATSGRRDLHDKLRAYERNGVQEYVVWRTYDSAIDWFVLRGGRYERLSPAADGMYRSEVFPGLWLDATALIRGDLAAVLAVLQQGTASSAHTDFIARLQAAKGP